jgi:hypothetical protein
MASAAIATFELMFECGPVIVSLLCLSNIPSLA